MKKLSLFLLVVTSCITANAQKTVSGTISDSKGAIPGANIIIEGTTRGTLSDFDGNYSLDEVPNNATLVFSYVGYVTKKIPVNGQNNINVVLVTDTQSLDEVVLVGYGTQRKESVTGSVVSIKGDDLNQVPASNFTEALQGRASGVELSRTSSKPGAPMQIRIRGVRSLSAENAPLIVLNGIPFSGSLNDINTNDIKSLDILKDASATAIYGSRGANGVILITTNTGLKGQKAKFSYNSYFATKDVFSKYPMMNSEEFVALRAAAGVYTNGVDESDDVNTDWQDLLYGTGFMKSHDVSVAGGTENGSYSGGIGYFKDEAVLPGQNYERISLRASLDQEIGAFRFGLTTNNNYSVNRGGNLGVYSSLSTTPITNPYNDDGSLKTVVHMPLDNSWVYTRNSVENLGDSWIDMTKAFGSYNNLFGEVKIPGVEGLKYRMNVGLNFRMSNSGSYTGEGVFSDNETNPSNASIGNSLTTDYVVENLVTYDRTFAEKHKVNVVGLFSAQQSRFNSSSIQARDIPHDDFQFYNLGRADGDITINPDWQGYTVSGLKSWMARAMYQYDDRYLFTATVRSDGSSRLGDGYEWNTYPAVSAGWNIGNESFMKDINAINTLKLRIGYGETSNQAIAPYATLGRLGTRPYNFGNDTYATGYSITNLPNPKLGWEFSETWNYGLDFSLFNSRLSGSIEYYTTNTSNILLNVGLPKTSGVNGYTDNIGETQNKGVEVALNGIIIDNLNGWTWEAGVNIYSNKNKLVALSSNKKKDEGNLWFVGHPINVIYDYEQTGIWNTTDDDYQYIDILEPGGSAGMIKVKYTGDYNPDGSPTRQIGADDRQIMDVNPDFQGGFNTRLAYKNFDLGVVGAFKSGGILISSLYGGNGYLNMLSGRRNNIKVDYWTPDNTDAKYPSPDKDQLRSGDNVKYANNMGYFDASYLKIRTITLGYNFEQKFIKNIGLEKLRIYCTAQNPFVLFSPYHKESGMDPETNSYGNENAAVPLPDSQKRLLTIGVSTPSTRNYLVGLNLTF